MTLLTNLKDKNLKRARKIINNRLSGLASGYLIEPIKGGASTRNYYRVYLPGLPVHSSAVIQLNNKRFRLDESDYYQVGEILRKLNLPVPAIYEDFSRDGALLLQDIGDSNLCDLASEIRDDTIALEALYRQAIDHMVVFQTRAIHYSQGVNAFQRAFDEKKLLWELDFMMKHFAASFSRYEPRGAGLKTLKSFFDDLVNRIAALPRVFCHRDYHSRNLMLWNEQVYIVDFQDARMGPHVYDLVSLLGDSYVDLGDLLRRKLLEYYLECHPDFSADDLHILNDQFNLVALQRHLKHLGTFGYQVSIGKQDCRDYMPLTFHYLEKNFLNFPEYEEAMKILTELFERSRKILRSES